MAADEMISLGTCERCGAYHGSWEPCGQRFTPEEAAKNDIAMIRHALGLPDSPRHLAEVQDDILPAIAALLAAAQRGAEDTRDAEFGLPPDESPARDAVVELLTAELVAIGAFADEAGETSVFDLRDESAIRGLARFMTSRDSRGRDGVFGERRRVFWEKLGRALAEPRR